MWNDTAGSDGSQMTIRCNSIACWITKATNTQTEYVTLIAFPLQQWLQERTSMLRHTYTAYHMLRSENVSSTLSPQPGGQEYLPLFGTGGPSSS